VHSSRPAPTFPAAALIFRTPIIEPAIQHKSHENSALLRGIFPLTYHLRHG
jgi:hypothetical protein